jgi:hypothetical protein
MKGTSAVGDDTPRKRSFATHARPKQGIDTAADGVGDR